MTDRLRTPRRILFGIFALYCASAVPAAFSPGLWNAMFGGFGLPWPEPVTPLFAYLADLVLVALVAIAFMAARVGFGGRWTGADRAFFLVMLAANASVDVRSLAQWPALRLLSGGDLALVSALLVVTALSPAVEARAAAETPGAPGGREGGAS